MLTETAEREIHLKLMAKSNLTMDELLAASQIEQIRTGDMVEGLVTSVRKHEVWVDLGANGVGVSFDAKSVRPTG